MPSSSQSRLAAVDFLRVVAFLNVALFHFTGMVGPLFPEGSAARTISSTIGRFGSLGTDTLFVLSSFLLCLTLNAGASPWRAVGRRLARIYPAFVAMLTLYLVLMLTNPQNNRIPEDPVTAFAYLLANLLLLPGMLPIEPIVTVAWSLSYIVFGYAVTAGLYRWGRLKEAGPARRCLVWAALGAIVLLSDLMGFTYGRLFFFPLGALLAEAVPFLRRMSPGRSIALGCAGLLVLAMGQGLWLSSAGLALIVTGLLSDPVESRLRRFPLRAFARISYPTFLTHGLVLHAMLLANPETNTLQDFVALLLGGISVIVATAKIADALALQPVTDLVRVRLSRETATA